LRALQAGGMGVPWLPVRGILGSAYMGVNSNFETLQDPFSGEDLVVVKALKPDVTLVHGAKGDAAGNILIPRRADWPLAIRASHKVIATVEERVPGPLQDEADWRLLPALHFTALVACPGGAAPTGLPGYYPQDEEHIAFYLKSAKDPGAWADYLEKYVRGTNS
jgi:glutaconate CoA-transferase, subunit A